MLVVRLTDEEKRIVGEYALKWRVSPAKAVRLIIQQFGKLAPEKTEAVSRD